LELAPALAREKFLVERGEGNPEKVKELEERLGFNFSEMDKLMRSMNSEELNSLDI
jgi:hypothetical protein